MDELADTGAFDQALSGEDELDRELREMRSNSEVEAELDTLRAEMGKESPAPTEREADSEVETVDADTDTEAEPADVDEEAVEAELEELSEEEQ
jgi:phage shock protein A